MIVISRSLYTKVDPYLGHLDVRVHTVLVLVVEYSQIKGGPFECVFLDEGRGDGVADGVEYFVGFLDVSESLEGDVPNRGYA